MLVLPAYLCKYLNLKPIDTVIVKEEKGKHGAYISIWKKEV